MDVHWPVVTYLQNHDCPMPNFHHFFKISDCLAEKEKMEDRTRLVYVFWTQYTCTWFWDTYCDEVWILNTYYVIFVVTFLWLVQKNPLTNKKFVFSVLSNFVIFQNWLMKCQRHWIGKIRQNSKFVNSLFMICNLHVGWFKLSRHGKLIGLVFPAFQTPAVHFPKVLPEKSTFTWLTFLISKNTLN